MDGTRHVTPELHADSTYSASGAARASVTDGRMCFPTDNVSWLSWGCCFPSFSLRCQNSTCVSPMKMDDSLSGGCWGIQRRGGRRKEGKDGERMQSRAGGKQRWDSGGRKSGRVKGSGEEKTDEWGGQSETQCRGGRKLREFRAKMEGFWFRSSLKCGFL